MKEVDELRGYLDRLREIPLYGDQPDYPGAFGVHPQAVEQHTICLSIRDIFAKVAGGEIPNPLSDPANSFTPSDLQNLIMLATNDVHNSYQKAAKKKDTLYMQKFTKELHAIIAPVYERMQITPGVKKLNNDEDWIICYGLCCEMYVNALCCAPEFNEQDSQKVGRLLKEQYLCSLYPPRQPWKQGALGLALEQRCIGDAYTIRARVIDNPKMKFEMLKRGLTAHSQAIDMLHPVPQELIEEVVNKCNDDASDCVQLAENKLPRALQLSLFKLAAGQYLKAIEVIETHSQHPEKEDRALQYQCLGELEGLKKKLRLTDSYKQASAYYRLGAEFAQMEGDSRRKAYCEARIHGPVADKDDTVIAI